MNTAASFSTLAIQKKVHIGQSRIISRSLAPTDGAFQGLGGGWHAQIAQELTRDRIIFLFSDTLIENSQLLS